MVAPGLRDGLLMGIGKPIAHMPLGGTAYFDARR
jgi:hypothetical protein